MMVWLHCGDSGVSARLIFLSRIFAIACGMEFLGYRGYRETLSQHERTVVIAVRYAVGCLLFRLEGSKI